MASAFIVRVMKTRTKPAAAAFAEAAAAASIVLLAVLLAMNAVAIFLRNRYATRW